MDLKSGYPFWAINNGLTYAFEPLKRDLACDVLIVGGGITGAIIARELANDGQDVVFIEQRDIGWGSSAASTALLQYEIDTHMTELAERYGEDDAVPACRSCADAVSLMQSLAAEVRDVDFAPMKSLYFASSLFHIGRLSSEYEMHARHGFDVELLNAHDVRERFGIKAPAAILSGLAGRVDSYRFTSRLLNQLRKRGVTVFDRTELESFEAGSRGIVARTTQGMTIKAGIWCSPRANASQKHSSVRTRSSTSEFRSRWPMAGTASPAAPSARISLPA